MTSDDPDAERVARSFAEFWRSLTQDGGGKQRQPEARKALLDQVRSALDRGETRLAGNGLVGDDGDIVANSFTLLERIHEGAATRIHRARHRDLGTLHAIKTLRPDHADDPVARHLLLREGQIGMALRHPQIVATQTVLRLADGRPALVFEWCGARLSDRLKQKPLASAEIVAVMRSLLGALDAIHRAGVVHCDVSPSNLLLSASDLSEIRLADFGIALRAGERHADLDLAFAGQPDFAAPEQSGDQAPDGRADLYSAGRLLHLLLHGCQGDGGELDALRATAAALSDPDPGHRPKNAKAALRMLDGLENRQTERTPPV